MQDQDQPIKFINPNGGVIVREQADQEELPPLFLEKLRAADVVLLVGSTKETGLTLQPVVKGGMYQPGEIVSHAFVDAVYANFDNLVRHVHGKPTDAQRFDAQRQFALMPGADGERFERINTMMQQFEEANPQAGKFPTLGEVEKFADFLVYAVIETAPLVVEQRPVVN